MESMREAEPPSERMRVYDSIESFAHDDRGPNEFDADGSWEQAAQAPPFDESGEARGEYDGVAEPMDEPRDDSDSPDRAIDIREDLDSNGSVEYRDRPCKEFRQLFPGEYTEPGIDTFEREPLSDPQEVINDINPRFDDGAEFKTNCADCARSFERTWRGDFEEAAGHVDPLRGTTGEASDRTEEWAGTQFSEVPVDEVRDRLLQAGHGSSAIVHSHFRNYDEGSGVWRNGGHAYNVVNYHGRIRVVDGQTHAVSPWAEGSGHPNLERVHFGGHEGWVHSMGWDAQNHSLWPNGQRSPSTGRLEGSER